MKHNNSWLTSDNFLKRCFGIYFHALVAHVIVVAAFFLVWFAFVGMFAANHFYGMRDAGTGRGVDMMHQRNMMERYGKDQGVLFERNMKGGMQKKPMMQQ